MADRVEREIEEILARLDKDLPADKGGSTPDRQPISITSARDVRAQRAKPVAQPRRLPFALEPSTLLMAGAAIMVGGFILSALIASSLIWLSFAGVIVFMAAFVWSFFRNKPATPETYAPGKVFWRDRYIDAHPNGPSTTDKIRRRFRR